MNISPQEVAQAATQSVLSAIHRGDSAVVIDSPPGAGKTTLQIKVAATAAGLLDESAMVACWTNRQAIDFARRAAQAYSKVPVTLFIKEELKMLVPAELKDLGNFKVVSKTSDVPGSGVVVSNASKWTVRQIPHRFEWLLVDEAYQIPEYRFRRLAPLAKRYVLVGDPGQIDPIIQSDVSPWGCDPDGPQVPCPTAAIHRQGLEPQNLPVSWRLPRETSALVRDAFYDFDFSSGDPEGRRSLRLGSGSAERIDETLDVLQGPGNSIAAAVLNGDKVGTDVDPELAEFVAAAVARMLDRGVTVTDENGFSSSLSPADIGVVTAHRAQVAEIDKRLRSRGVATGEGAVVVETTERWQGLERHVMIVHHPLAGLDSLSSFDLDRGRLCVMLSRHKTSCLIVAREGIEETLRNHPHEGQRFAGGRDEEYRGWVANRLVWARLREAGAMVEAN